MDLNKIAIHESGHAIQYIIEGAKIKSISLVSSPKSLGKVEPLSNTTESLSADAHVRILLSGLSSEIAKFSIIKINSFDNLKDYSYSDLGEGWIQDFERACEWAKKFCGCDDFENGIDLECSNCYESCVYD